MAGTRRAPGSVVLGGILILLGLLLMLNNLGIVDFGDVISDWWPLILIGAGLFNLAQTGSLTAPTGWVPIVLGSVFLLATLDYLRWSRVWDLWPVALIVAGLSIVFGRGGATREGEADESELRISAMFSAVERRVTSDAFRGGRVSAVFGGAEVDLRQAELTEQGATLGVSAFFGGVELYLPRHWKVVVNPSAVLGGVDEKCNQEPQPADAPTLVVNASAVFGGIDIRN